jgi:DNA-binding GntR family transcriptional regulator
MFRPRVVLASHVYENLRTELAHGTIEPGAKLVEAEIAARLGVSRTPVREALRHLEAEGFVQREGAGLVAMPYDTEQALEVLLIRELLEPRCAETSARELTATDFSRLRALVDEMAAAVALDADRVHVAELNNSFHETLYLRCPHLRLLSEVKRMRENFVSYWLYGTYTAEELNAVVDEHREIVDLAERTSRGEEPPALIAEKIGVHLANARFRLARHEAGAKAGHGPA